MQAIELTEGMQVQWHSEYIAWCKKLQVRWTDHCLWTDMPEPPLTIKSIEKKSSSRGNTYSYCRIFLLQNTIDIGFVEILEDGTKVGFVNSPIVFDLFNPSSTEDKLLCPKCGNPSVRVGARFAYRCIKCGHITGF